MRERMDDVQKKVRGIDELEQRVAKLEKQLADLQKPKAKPKTRSTLVCPQELRERRQPQEDLYLAGTLSRIAAGAISKRTGAVPGCSPSSCTGSGSGVSTSTMRPRSTSAFGCGRNVPL